MREQQTVTRRLSQLVPLGGKVKPFVLVGLVRAPGLENDQVPDGSVGESLLQQRRHSGSASRRRHGRREFGAGVDRVDERRQDIAEPDPP